MKTNSRFDCLKEPVKKKQRSREPAPVQTQEPIQTQEPMPVQTQEPVHMQTQEPVQTQEPPPAPIMSWKDKIKASKEQYDPYKPIKGCIIMYKDKKTNKIHRIEHPVDIAEQQIREKQEEEYRLYQCYVNSRQRLINDFIYDLEMGKRDDFNNVEEYIEYLDKPDEEPEEEEEDIMQVDEYDSQDEYNSYDEN